MKSRSSSSSSSPPSASILHTEPSSSCSSASSSSSSSSSSDSSSSSPPFLPLYESSQAICQTRSIAMHFKYMPELDWPMNHKQWRAACVLTRPIVPPRCSRHRCRPSKTTSNPSEMSQKEDHKQSVRNRPRNNKQSVRISPELTSNGRVRRGRTPANITRPPPRHAPRLATARSISAAQSAAVLCRRVTNGRPSDVVGGPPALAAAGCAAAAAAAAGSNLSRPSPAFTSTISTQAHKSQATTDCLRH